MRVSRVDDRKCESEILVEKNRKGVDEKVNLDFELFARVIASFD